MAQMVKKPLAMQEKTWVRSVGWENPLEKGIPTHTSILAWRRAYQPTLVFLPEEGIPTHTSILAWRIPMDREAWSATVHQVAKSRT